MGLMQIRRAIASNDLHIETVSGSSVTFTTNVTAPLQQCIVKFLPNQSGSGDPSPSNIRTISNTTLAGIQFSTQSTGQFIAWSSNATEGQSYGGYIDLVSGTIVVTYNCIDLGTLNYSLFNDSTLRQAWQTDDIIDLKQTSSTSSTIKAYSSQFKIVSNDTTWYPYMISGHDSREPYRIYVTFDHSAYNDSSQVKSALSGISFVYELQTPRIYSHAVSGQNIIIEAGENIITSSTNGDLIIKYWIH